ncbi:MAG TPA: XdhC family protein [Caulobacteraceae bacterium]|jgi:xanthine dehydrogenase accessory factor|nr:XdhC family protein [Caulobacteraceae bacterium]
MTTSEPSRGVIPESVDLSSEPEPWPLFGLDADIRPALARALQAERSAALLTVYAAIGGAPRGVGAQMLVTSDGKANGYLAGGCVEADAIRHALACLDDGKPRTLTYGVGGPTDLPLACGGSIEVLIERLDCRDGAARALASSLEERRSVVLITDGVHRRCVSIDDTHAHGDEAGATAKPFEAWRLYDPPNRLVVVGSDPTALALTELAARSRIETTLVRPFGPATESPVEGARYRRDSMTDAFSAIGLDRWTAVVSATHDADIDHEALYGALSSHAFYVAAVGSRRRAPETRARLHDAGLSEADVDRLHTPAGIALGGRSPGEIAISILAEMIEIDRATRATRRLNT